MHQSHGDSAAVPADNKTDSSNGAADFSVCMREACDRSDASARALCLVEAARDRSARATVLRVLPEPRPRLPTSIAPPALRCFHAAAAESSQRSRCIERKQRQACPPPCCDACSHRDDASLVDWSPSDTTGLFSSLSMSAPAPTAAAVPAASATPAAPGASAAPVPLPAKIYDPRAALSALDASVSLPDETENARLSQSLEHNVASLMATKQSNERKQQVVGSILNEKYKSMEHERAKLLTIKQELAKLDQSLSRNIDVLRQEIETVGRECNTLQKDFDYKEKEYLAARKALAKTKQRKLLLTSHLDYIILTNEQEKATKLAELEVSLGLNPSTPGGTLIAGPPRANGSGNGVAASPAKSGALGMAPSTPSTGASPAAIAAAAASEARFLAAQAAAAIPRDHPGLQLDVVAPPGFGGFADEEQQAAQQQMQHPHHFVVPAAQPSTAQQPPQPQHQQQQQQQQQPRSTNPFVGPQTPVSPEAVAQAFPEPPPQQPQQQPQQSRRNESPLSQQQLHQRQSSAAAIATARHVAPPPRKSAAAAAAPAAATPPPRQSSRNSMSSASLSSQQSYLPDGGFAGFSE